MPTTFQSVPFHSHASAKWFLTDSKGCRGPGGFKWKVLITRTGEVTLLRVFDQPLGGNLPSDPILSVPLGSRLDWDYLKHMVTNEGSKPSDETLSPGFRQFLAGRTAEPPDPAEKPR